MRYVKFLLWTVPCGIIGVAALGVAAAWLFQVYSTAYATHEVNVQNAALEDITTRCDALMVHPPGDVDSNFKATPPYVPKQNLQEWAAHCAAQFGAPDSHGVVANW